MESFSSNLLKIHFNKNNNNNNAFTVYAAYITPKSLKGNLYGLIAVFLNDKKKHTYTRTENLYECKKKLIKKQLYSSIKKSIIKNMKKIIDAYRKTHL